MQVSQCTNYEHVIRTRPTVKCVNPNGVFLQSSLYLFVSRVLRSCFPEGFVLLRAKFPKNDRS